MKEIITKYIPPKIVLLETQCDSQPHLSLSGLDVSISNQNQHHSLPLTVWSEIYNNYVVIYVMETNFWGGGEFLFILKFKFYLTLGPFRTLLFL